MKKSSSKRMNRTEAKEWWIDKLETHRYLASAPTSVRPELSVRKFGHHCSVVFEKGTRQFAFVHKRGRDLFVKENRCAEAIN